MFDLISAMSNAAPQDIVTIKSRISIEGSIIYPTTVFYFIELKQTPKQVVMASTVVSNVRVVALPLRAIDTIRSHTDNSVVYKCDPKDFVYGY